MRRPLFHLRKQSAVGLALALAITGCSSGSSPGTNPNLAYPTATARTIFVSRGETAYDVARRYNVPLRDLIEANRLQPPYALTPGQSLVLPVPREYAVQAGDTIYGLSRRFELDMNELVRLNGIAAPYTLQVGQVLRLPGSRPEVPRTMVAEAPPQAVPRPSVQSAPIQTAPLDPAPVQSAPVQAAPAPATATRPPSRTVETAELPPMAGAVEPARPSPPPAAQPAPASEPPARQAPAQSPPAAVKAPAPVVEPPVRAPERPQQQAATPLPAPTAPPVQVAPKPQAAVTPPAPAPRQGKRFLWPLQGPILSEFGPKPGGLYNDGINIGGAQGTPVQAAENGVVVYAGNELKGYGNLILVRHAEGWLTAYAHLDAMEVDRGAQVKRGQRIGTVGRTGNVRSPQLHFGIRRNEKAMDPKDHLETGAS